MKWMAPMADVICCNASEQTRRFQVAYLDDRGVLRGANSMMRLCLVALFSAIAVLLISCGGSQNSSSAPVGPNGQPATNAPGCDNTNNASCTVLMVTQSDGTIVTRYYVLHVPANFPANGGALVVALHGTGESALEYPTHTLMNTTADADGFAVVYPEALDAPRNGNLRQWNFYFNGAKSPTDTSPDDVSFIRQLITTLQPTLNADPKKTYVEGISAGGQMALRAAVQLSDLVAAVGALSETITLQEGGPSGVVPTPLGPVSAIMIHADEDQIIPYCGGQGYASQDVTFNFSAATDAALNLDTSTSLCVNGKPTAVNEKDATGGLLNSEVKFYRLIGTDHFAVYNNADLSPYNPNLNATTGTLSNDIVWNFFAAHPKP
jgi:polyhydroxybutyrate depolymerase